MSSLGSRSRRRSCPVRLSEIPLEVRLHAALTEARRCKTPAERLSLMAAALHPSEQVYYVADLEPVERSA